MAKRGRKRASPAGDRTPALRRTVAKRSKGELVDIVMELVGDDRRLMRRVAERIGLEDAGGELVAATRQAIADATDFDERYANHNFDYDYDAYAAVKRNFALLIKGGELAMAMELSLELMKAGSYQVEMSDEGLMTEEIEECLRVVLGGLKKGKLPRAEVAAWCAQMLKIDRVGFICRRELEELRG